MERGAIDEPDTLPVTVEFVRDRIADGSMVLTDTCVVCGRPTWETVWFHLECDRATTVEPPRRARQRSWLGRLAAVIVGHDGAVIEPPAFGIEWIPLEVPLNIHPLCRDDQLWNRSEHSLRMLLRVVPLYSDLLAHHPRTRVRVVGS